MNSDILAGKWSQIKGHLKESWSDLTETDLENTKSSLHEAVGYLQEKYGETKENIETKLYDLLSSVDNKIQ